MKLDILAMVLEINVQSEVIINKNGKICIELYSTSYSDHTAIHNECATVIYTMISNWLY